jgi:hypothetical protein
MVGMVGMEGGLRVLGDSSEKVIFEVNGLLRTM